MSRKELEPADVTAICDTREQAALDLLLPTEVGTLKTGDYSVKGLEHVICVERKSLADLVMCCGRERERFEACVQRMRAYETRVLVIEASWGAIELGQWRSQLKPNHVKGTLYSWMKWVSVILAGDPQAASAIVSGVLFSAARHRWREAQSFLPTLKIDTTVAEIAPPPAVPA